jgi:putative N6-adenine-specific DNA methylase
LNALSLFLPCAAGVESWLLSEVQTLLGADAHDARAHRAGVTLRASWRDVLRLNLHSRLAQRVLVQLSDTPYRQEQDIYDAARQVPWERWFTPRQTFKIEITSQHSPLKSLNFAALRVKDAVADHFRDRRGERPSVEVKHPDVRIYVHLTGERMMLALDTSGEPLFKRGWRVDKGDAPLKETLAAAMLAASGWSLSMDNQPPGVVRGIPLYDPCCGSGTIAIEAAQIACGMAPGLHRRFAFEKLQPFEAADWASCQQQARSQQCAPRAAVFGSDVAFRMVDFAQHNAERAGVSHAVSLRGGDALQRMPPCETPGVLMVNPPYGERIDVGGVARAGGRQQAQMVRMGASSDAGHAAATARAGAGDTLMTAPAGDFFQQLASHWKKNFPGWTAWVLSPDARLPGQMRLKETRRVPMWNGPIECRLFRFDLVAGRMPS